MRYSVTRTSDYGASPECPCEGATLAHTDEWGEKVWVLEIGTLEELASFINKYGSVVIRSCYAIEKDYADFGLEIYDSFRE